MMISADEARNIILGAAPKIRVETVPLLDAHRRILAADIHSKDDIPPFKNSSMDGFALRSVDTLSSSPKQIVELKIFGEVAAGDVAGATLQPIHAIRILTGAPLPIGADAVVPLEQVEERDGVIRLSAHVAPGSCTRERGEDIKAGDRVLLRGMRIETPHLGVLASIGCTDVEVFQKPTIAILTTGNELLSVDEKLRDGKIRNSNSFSLRALAEENDCEPIAIGVARDNEEELLQKMREGLKYDILVTSGGVSAGKYDYVLESLKKAGVNLRFWKVNIKPGMPLAFGIYSKDKRNVPVFSLPGNPVSTVVTFLEFVKPCLDAMMSKRQGATRLHLQAKLDHALSKSDGKRHYHRGIVQSEKGELHVRSTGNQSSGVLTSLIKANCLIILKEQQTSIEGGEQVDIELLPWARIE